jgi:hypothetical protein
MCSHGIGRTWLEYMALDLGLGSKERYSPTIEERRQPFAFRPANGLRLPAPDSGMICRWLSRITDDEMKRLNIEISRHIAEILALRDNDPDKYAKRIDYFLQYCKHWEKKRAPNV